MDPRDLVAALKQNVGTQTGGSDWWGTVTAVNTGPPKTVTVNMNGGPTIAVRYSAAYGSHTPAIGDVVFGRSDGAGDWWAQDRLA